MKSASQLKEVPHDKNSVVTVGSFDGMHRAHYEIIREVVERARRRKGRSVLITFEPHPREVVGNQKGVPILTTLEEKQELAARWGIDVFLTVAFDYAFSRQSAREFYLNYLVQGVGVHEVIEGFDHHFGRDREGSIREMRSLGNEFGYTSVAVQQVFVGDQPVSSTVIRNYLLEGDVERAAALLGRSYGLDGTVVRGDMRGRTLGFPTANIHPISAKKLVPKNGIYFVRVNLSGEWHFGIASIGVRPTFKSDGQRIVEIYVLDFEKDIYGSPLRVEFHRRLRDEIQFESAGALVEQMNRDKMESMRLRDNFKEQNVN